MRTSANRHNASANTVECQLVGEHDRVAPISTAGPKFVFRRALHLCTALFAFDLCNGTCVTIPNPHWLPPPVILVTLTPASSPKVRWAWSEWIYRIITLSISFGPVIYALCVIASFGVNKKSFIIWAYARLMKLSYEVVLILALVPFLRVGNWLIV